MINSKRAKDHTKNLNKVFRALRKYKVKLNIEKCIFKVLAKKFLGFVVSQRGIEVNPDKIKAIFNI